MSEYSTVAAYFTSQASAESAMLALRKAGFQQSQIGVAAAGGVTPSPAYAAAGESKAHASGSTWEKVKSFFAGDSAEPYAGEASRESLNDNVITPEYVEPEDVHGSFSGLAVPEAHTRYFGRRLGGSEEGAVVTVNASGREEEAKAILEEYGGDAGEDAAEFNYGEVSQEPAPVHKIQLLGEVLRVHKDRVSRGEVRLRKEVVTSTQTIEVPVVREELVLERIPVNGEQPVDGDAAFTGQEVRIPLSEERAAVTKEAVVKEEVKVGKKQVDSVEAFDESVRHEELRVDDSKGKVS